MKTILILLAVFVFGPIVWERLHEPYSENYYDMDSRHDLDNMPW